MKVNKMDKKVMVKKTLEILAGIAKSAVALDPASLDFSTALEEMKDCTLLLEDGFSDKAVFTTANQTTSGELYDLLKDIAKPASEIKHSTSEEHVIDRTEVK